MKLSFEWDENKNQKNIVKHGIDFSYAIGVFCDNQRIEFYDKNHSMNEDRYITIGKVHEILFVVFTERTNNIRIISARIATTKEKELYYGNSQKND